MIRSPGEASRRPGLAIFCVVIFAVCSLWFDHFASADNLRAIALQSSVTLIAAIGAMALLVTGNIDVSIGSVYALVGVVVATVNVQTGSAATAAASGLVVGALLGAINGLLVEVLRISSLIVTLATLAVYRGLAYLVSDGHSVVGLTRGLSDFGQSQLGGIPMTLIVALAAFGACTWFLSASVTGLRLFAIGGNRSAATMLGVPAKGLVVRTFALNGALVGGAAVIGTATLATGTPAAAAGLEFNVLTAVILGGVAFHGGNGHPLGVLFGVATIGVLDAGLVFAGLEDWYQQIARGCMLLLALAIDFAIAHRARTRQVLAAPERTNPAVDIVPVAPQRAADLSVRGLSVRFPGVDALTDVDLDFRAGEVACLVGDNGAGKSVLVKALSGAIDPTAGSMQFDGSSLGADPRGARNSGIETVFQEPALCSNLSGIDNLVLGLEPKRWLFGVLPMRDLRAARQVARQRLSSLGLGMRELERPVHQLSGGQRQLLAIMRVVRPDARLIVLDEPTASLGVHQGSVVLELVRRIAQSQRAVIYVTHDVEEVFEVADRVVVLQRGRVIFDGSLETLTRLELLSLMSGRNRQEAKRTLRAVDEERSRIERDLHDGAQQELLAAATMVGLAADQLGPRADPQLAQLLSTSRETMRQALGTLRSLSRGTFPIALGEAGLKSALQSLADRSAIEVELTVDVPRLHEKPEQAAYFIVAEAMTNAQRHADCAHLAVTARHVGDRLSLEISDDGGGGVDESLGTGVAGMRARAASIGGRMTVVSEVGQGTQLCFEIPAIARADVQQDPRRNA